MPRIDVPAVLRASAIRYRGFRARGVPAILLGVTGIVLAAGAARTLAAAAPSLPETLREAKALADALRGERPRLNP